MQTACQAEYFDRLQAACQSKVFYSTQTTYQLRVFLFAVKEFTFSEIHLIYTSPHAHNRQNSIYYDYRDLGIESKKRINYICSF
jgi:hypothetical protein